MKKVAIVGVEGSGKTVMLAGLGELYSRPDQDGYFLMPKNFSTAAYVSNIVRRMRGGEWPTATAEDVLQGLDWTLKRRQQGGRPETICEVSCLDFAGEVYRSAFGIRSEDGTIASDEVKALKDYIREADELIVLINLRDVITRGIDDPRVQEAMWITNSILSVALDETGDRQPPRAMIALSQADSYAETIMACGGAKGVLEQYLPYVANNYDWLDMVSVSAVDRTIVDDEGNVVPAPDFTPGGLRPLLVWILNGAVLRKRSERGNGKSVQTNHEHVSKVSTGGEVFFKQGLAFELGDGCRRSYDKALEFYQKAANLGHGHACHNLGLMCEFGRGVRRDIDKARSYYQAAVALGDAEGQAELARLAGVSKSNSQKESRKKIGKTIASSDPRPGDMKTITLPGGATMEMVWCPATTSAEWKCISGGDDFFWMGSPNEEKGRSKDEIRHRVTLTRGFWMGKYEVTQKQWKSVMGKRWFGFCDNNPSFFKGDNRPVENVSWDDCQEFIRKVNSVGGVTVALPTEAQWEYACRAGTTGPYTGELDEMAWYAKNSNHETHDVGTKKPNAWGLYDMHGNVFEWCADWYDDYPDENISDPTGPASGGYRVYRGSGWINGAQFCRSAGRGGYEPGFRGNCLGFRLVCSLP